jgi:hypothetical protein
LEIVTANGDSVEGKELARGVTAAMSKGFDQTVLRALQGAWQKAGIEARMAEIRKGPIAAAPQPKQTKLRGTNSFLDAACPGAGGSVTLMLGGTTPRQWTVAPGKPARVAVEPGTYPLAIEHRAGAETKRYAGQLVVAEGNSYSYEFK